MTEHAPTPWTYRDVSGAGLEICAPVYRVTGIELPRGMPEAPIKTFDLASPANVLVACERWVQFEPKGWSEMQEANAAFIVKAVNNHDALVAALTLFLATDETMEGILWGSEPNTALIKISIPLGQYREARAALRAAVGGALRQGERS